MSVKWKKETGWMEVNGIDVELEFQSKVKEVDEILEIIG